MAATSLFVLAGGFGTRLRAVVQDVPKPLAPVDGQPFLAHLIPCWKAQGIRDLYLLLHHEANQVLTMLESVVSSGELDDMRIHTLIEAKPLGTGGAVANAIKEFEIKDSFLVTNADTWLGAGIRELAVASPCAIGVIKVPNSQRYGVVRFHEGVVLEFAEKSDSDGAGWVNAGLYHLTPDVFERHSQLESFSMERDVFPGLVASGSLTAVALETDFIDIGIPEDYFKFCEWIESEKKHELS